MIRKLYSTCTVKLGTPLGIVSYSIAQTKINNDDPCPIATTVLEAL